MGINGGGVGVWCFVEGIEFVTLRDEIQQQGAMPVMPTMPTTPHHTTPYPVASPVASSGGARGGEVAPRPVKPPSQI